MQYDYIGIFEEFLQLNGYAESTRAGHICALNRFLTWLDDESFEVEQTTYNDMMAYVQHLKSKGLMARSQQADTGALKVFFKGMIELGHMAKNPCLNIEIKGVKRKHLYATLSKEQLDEAYKKYLHYLDTMGAARPSAFIVQRNKVVFGLIVYQGIRAKELEALTIQHVQLRKGEIEIPTTRRKAGRKLKLEPHQLYDMMDYVNGARKEILSIKAQKTDQLILTTGSSNKLANMLAEMFKDIRKACPNIKNHLHLRASVVANLLKTNNTRKAQYLAGHKYVSSTESYKANNIETLIEEVNKFHPDL